MTDVVKAKVEDFVMDHRGYVGVTYYYYNEDGKDVVAKKVSDISGAASFSGACFINLASQVGKIKNRILYVPKSSLSNEDVIRWLKFCIKQKILPDYIDPESYKTGIALDLTEPRSLTYVYLCNIRYIAEEPALARAVMHLVEVEKISVYAALVLAGLTLCSNYNHNYLIGHYSYGGGPKLSSVKIQLRNAIGLRNYYLDPKKYNGTHSAFTARGVIDKAMADVKIELELKWSDFQHPLIRKALKSKTAEQLSDLVKEYKKFKIEKKKKVKPKKI